MHVFDYSFLDTGLLPAEMVTLTSTIAAFNAISNERKEQNKSVYTELEKIAKIQSVKGSNAIEGIVTTDVRIKAIVNGNSAPLNHSEREIAGYRDALDEIHRGFELMPINESTILHLHQVMTSAAGYDQSGQYKAEDNLIMEVDMRGRRRVRFEPVSAAQTGEAMEQLILAYMDARDNPRISKLLLIPCVVLDFLCIHPFADGNGRVSRLLTLLLLYKNGYNVGKYISIEKIIEETKETYYEALQDSSINWHENTNNYKPFVNYMLGVIVAAYREFESRVKLVTNTNISKSERIRETIKAHIGTITKADILEENPDISDTTVQRALAALLKKNEIKKIGGGRYTKYVWNAED